MRKEFLFSEKRASEEGQKIQSLVGESGTKEDYQSADDLVNEETQKKTELVQKKFNNVLKNKLNLIPRCAGYESKLDGINKITILNYSQDGSSQKKKDSTPYVTVFYDAVDKNGQPKEHHKTITLTNEGDLIGYGTLPGDILGKFSKTEFLEEIIDIALQSGAGKWLSLEGETIIPPGGWSQNKEGRESSISERRKAPIDPERIDFFLSHPALVLAVQPGISTRINYGRDYGTGVPVAGGLSEYHIFLFPRGVIFENAICNNRIFWNSFEEGISPETLDKLKSGEISDNEKRKLLEDLGVINLARTSKAELIAGGMGYRRHSGYQSSSKKDFYQELRAFIDGSLL